MARSPGPFSACAWSATELGRRLGVDIPITQTLDRILGHDADAERAMAELLAHPYDFEWPEPVPQILRPNAG
jgi:hypothetical protein